MSFLKRLFKAEDREKALADIILGWRWGEPKDIDQKKLVELAEGDIWARTAFDITVDAVVANGYVIKSENEAEKKQVETWINDNKHDFNMFLRNVTRSLLVFDEVYVEVFAESMPKVIDTWTMRIERDQFGKVVAYVQEVAGKRITFKPEEIVHVAKTPLGSRVYGSPLLTTLRRVIEGQMQVENFIKTAFERKAVLSYFFKIRGTEDDYTRLKSALEQSRPGESILALVGPSETSDIEAVKLSEPFSDMKVLEIQRENRQKIMSATRVPPILMGIEGGTNLETSRNQMNSFTLYVKSLQELVNAVVTQVLRRRFNVNIVFELLEWVNPEQETRLHAMRVDAGIETINEAREALGLPRIEHPMADLPLPFFRILGRMETQDMLSELIAQSQQAFPEKSLEKARDRDIHDENVLRLERLLKRELGDFFRRLSNSDQPVNKLRIEYDEDVRDLLRSYLIRAALEGVLYLDDVDVAPPMAAAAEEVVARLLPTFVEDFWLVVADKKSGLAKPSKPRRDYQRLLKAIEENELDEEDIYPEASLNYEERVDLIASTLLWLSFAGGIYLAAKAARQKGFLDENVKFRWVAKNDEKTCPICSELDGRVFGLEEGFVFPPIHPHCRCRIVAVKNGRSLFA